MIDKAHAFLDNSFNKELETAGFSNTPDDIKMLKTYLTQMFTKAANGQFTFPLPLNLMNGDAINLFFAEEVIKQYKPELTVVNMTNVDICHSNFTQYCDFLTRADYSVAHLWQTIQSTPGMANDTILIVVPEHGRNAVPNSIYDSYGRPALDHTNDDSPGKFSA